MRLATALAVLVLLLTGCGVMRSCGPSDTPGWTNWCWTGWSVERRTPEMQDFPYTTPPTK